MFTFGIFTTHLPYIAMVAFYAWFLVCGVNQSSKGKIQLAEKSPTVQIHINNSDKSIQAESYCFYDNFMEITASAVFEKAKENQKWKYTGLESKWPLASLKRSLFCRPPPLFC